MMEHNNINNVKNINNCNIVRDLLPLYMEELCSEDSRKYVETHLSQCEDCMNSCLLLRRPDLSADSAEAQEINAFKKLKTHLTEQKLIGYILFLAVLTVGISVLLLTVAANNLYHVCYALLMPLAMLATDFAFRGKTSALASKSDILLLIPQIIVLLFSTCVMFFSVFRLYRGADSVLFGLPPERTGPVMAALFKAAVIVSLVIFAICLYQIIRQRISYGMLPNISILCIFLNLNYLSPLYRMSDISGLLSELVRNTLLLCGICAFLILITWAMRLVFKTKSSAEP